MLLQGVQAKMSLWQLNGRAYFLEAGEAYGGLCIYVEVCMETTVKFSTTPDSIWDFLI